MEKFEGRADSIQGTLEERLTLSLKSLPTQGAAPPGKVVETVEKAVTASESETPAIEIVEDQTPLQNSQPSFSERQTAVEVDPVVEEVGPSSSTVKPPPSDVDTPVEESTPV